MPTIRAEAQSPKTGQDDIPAPRLKADDKAITDLKTALNATQKELKDLKDAAAATKAALAESQKTAADALAKAEAAQKNVAAPKADGESKSLAEKFTALEKAATKTEEKASEAATIGKERGDSAWVMTASAFVMCMIPGLALFYCGMVRRKNVLATMMQSMAALAVVGLYWIVVGYALAFGPSLIKMDLFGVKDGGIVGWSTSLLFLQGIGTGDKLPGYDIPVYMHVMFQGMFAIITPALISGAIAERIRFWPFCIFMILWVTFVYCPLAHMVWAFDWFDSSVVAAKRGTSAIGLLGMMGALDFAGGTVVHIAAGMAGLACCLVLGKARVIPKWWPTRTAWC